MESNNQFKRRADDLSRKRKALLASVLVTAATSVWATQANAQTFAEWFSQKKTQKKYMLEQMAALQVYSGYLKHGYKIANGGLGYITGSLKEEFRLHATLYDKLRSVNAVVKNNPQVGNILTWQRDILRSGNSLEQATYLSAQEKLYVGKVKQALLADCDEQITALQFLLANGKLTMSDDERLKRLNSIHLAMRSNYRFMAGFAGKIKVYGLQKKQEATNLETSKYLFGIR